ncbi:hypothetical protein ACHAPF_011391 [Botrytis cinerea]
MTSSNGYAIIRDTVAVELVQQAADKAPVDLVVKMYSEYSDLAELLETDKVPPLKSVKIGIFRPTTPDPKRMKAGLKREVYVTIALTDLNLATRFFIFPGRSHKRTFESSLKVEGKESRLCQ